VLTVLISARAVLEENTLTAELDGYADYRRRVRYRLVPGVW
jgi:protein-S-isoprenylcysteine O-methyltransferase Ste14